MCIFRLADMLTASLLIYRHSFIWKQKFEAEFRASMSMLGQLPLHNVRGTCRSHLIHTADQLIGDSSSSIAPYQQAVSRNHTGLDNSAYKPCDSATYSM